MTTQSTTTGTGTDPLESFVPRMAASWTDPSTTRHWDRRRGTLASADVSGFTALSERLASRGRRGAEDLTDLLNTCFDGVIGAALAYGGDVLKFGGDAVLVWFEGERHEERAVAACLAMREHVAVPLADPDGHPIRLGISIGAHTGDFLVVATVGSHRELVVTGAAVSNVVACESAAGAGHIVVSPDLADRLPKGRLGRRVELGRRVRRGPGLPPLPDAALSHDSAQLDQFVPASQLAVIATGAQGEHRHAAIAFVELVGTDQLESAGPSVVADAVQSVMAAIDASTDRWRTHFLATDVALNGLKFIVAGGVPTTAGNDEDRLIRTVLDVVDAVPDLDVRAGLNCGQIYVGLLGATRRRTFTIMGDDVNLAARLMQRAGRRSVVVSRAALDWSDTIFEEDALQPFMVKGKSAPVHAAIVGGPVGPKEANAIHTLPLVGRRGELERLRRSAREAAAGRGSVVAIGGDAGVGKSRLLAELVSLSPELRSLTVTALEYRSNTPYALMRQVLRRVAGCPEDAGRSEAGEHLRTWITAIAPEQLPWLPLVAIAFDADVEMTPETDDIAPRFRPARLRHAVGKALEGAIRDPSLLVVDDAHWVDEASGELLADVAGDVSGRPWLLCLAFTDREVRPRWATELPGFDLEPLDRDDSERLVAMATQPDNGTATLDSTSLARVVRAGEGNPLFLTTLTAAASDDRTGDDELPASIQQLVTRQIDQLQASDRALLRDMSVAGTVVDLALLARALGTDSVRGSDAFARLEGLLVRSEPGVVSFRHGMLHRVAYEGLSFSRRRQVHGALATQLEHDGADAALLSLHYSRAQIHESAFVWSAAAGRAAQGTYANSEAAELLKRALGHASRDRPDDEVGSVAESLGDVLELNGDYEEAAGAYETARRWLRSGSVAMARVQRKRGVIHERIGRYTVALGTYTRSLRTLEQHPTHDGTDEEIAQLELAYAGVRYRQGRMRDARAWCERAVASAVEAGAPAVAGHVYSLATLVDIATGIDSGAGRLALPLLEEAGDLQGQAKLWNNLGVAAYFRGDWDQALHDYRRSEDLSRRLGDLVGEATSINNVGEILSDRGELDPATELFERARAVFEAADYPTGVALTVSNLGVVMLRIGRHDIAERLLGEAAETFQAIQAGAFMLATSTRVASCRVARGRPVEAIEILEDVLRRSADSSDAFTLSSAHRVRANALAMLARHDEALATATTALEIAVAAGAPFEEALAATARATAHRRVGADDEAEADQRRATELFERLGVLTSARHAAEQAAEQVVDR